MSFLTAKYFFFPKDLSFFNPEISVLSLIILSLQLRSLDDDAEGFGIFSGIGIVLVISLSSFHLIIFSDVFWQFDVIRFFTFMPRYCFLAQGSQNSNFDSNDKIF